MIGLLRGVEAYTLSRFTMVRQKQSAVISCILDESVSTCTMSITIDHQRIAYKVESP